MAKKPDLRIDLHMFDVLRCNCGDRLATIASYNQDGHVIHCDFYCANCRLRTGNGFFTDG